MLLRTLSAVSESLASNPKSTVVFLGLVVVVFGFANAYPQRSNYVQELPR